MTTFPISVQVNTGGAVNGAKAVGTALAAAGAAGAAAGKAIGDGLDKASVSGQKAIASAKALALSMGGIARAMTQEGLGSVSKAFAGLNEQLEREARLFEAIRGPIREYEANVQSLAMLHKRGTINAREYAQAVADQRAAVDHGGSVAKGAAKDAGGGMSLMALGGTALAAGYAVSRVAGAADDYTNLQKQLGGVERSMGAASMPAKQLYERLYDISQLTGSSTESVTEGFSRMSIATKSMGLSQERVLGVQTTLAKFISQSGVSAEGASSAMTQFGQALASGRLQGDEFRSMSENFPELLAAMANGLGVTTGKLREMSSNGELTSEVLIGQLERMAPATDKAFDKAEKTFGSRWQKFKNFTGRVVGEGANYESVGDMADRLKDNVNARITEAYERSVKTQDFSAFAGHEDIYEREKAAYEMREKAAQEQRVVNDSISVFTSRNNAFLASFQKEASVFIDAKAAATKYGEQLEKLKHDRAVIAAQKLFPEVHGIPTAALDQADLDLMQQQRRLTTPGAAPVFDMRDQAQQASLKLQQLRTEYDAGSVSVAEYDQATAKLTRQLTDLVDPLAQVHRLEADRRLSAPTGAGPALDIQDQIDDTTTKLKQLDDLHGKTGVSARANALAHKQLADQLMSLSGATDYYKRVLDDIRQPGIDFRGSMAALNAMFAGGRVSVVEYGKELQKLGSSFYGSDVMAAVDKIAAFLDKQRDKSFTVDSGFDEIEANGGFAYGISMTVPTEAEDDARVKYEADVAQKIIELRREYMSPDQGDLSADLALQEKREQARKTPADRAHDSTNEAIRGFRDGSLSASAYADEIDRIRVGYLEASGEAKTFAGGAELGLMDIRKQAEDAGASIREALVGGFHAVEDALVQLVTKGKIDWSSLIDSMIAGLARLAIQQAMAKVVLALVGGDDDKKPGVPSGIIGTLLDPKTWEDPPAPAPRTASDVTPQLPSGAAASSSAARQAPIAVHVYPETKGALLAAIDSPSGKRRIARVVLKDTPIAAAIRSRNS